MALSQSLLWRLHRRYFEEQGVSAWSEGRVPFYVTSNARIASAYARLILGFLRDARGAGVAGGRHGPVHLIELGAGPGRFSFQLLQSFLPLIRASALRDLQIRYVMTDFSPATLDAWERHPYLRKLVDEGVLDFALFDAEDPKMLELRHAGTVLERFPGPLVVIANYVFDCIPTDCFSVEKGELREKLVSLASSADLDLTAPGALADLEIVYRHRPADTDHYDDRAFNRILDGYAATLADGDFLFPVAALRCLRFFAAASEHGALVLAADKGYVSAEELVGLVEPQIARHDGCFSLMVNFDAIARYVADSGGVAHRNPLPAVHLQLGAFTLGPPPGDGIETAQAFREEISRFGPDDFFTLKQALDSHFGALGAPELLAYLRLSDWDPDCFLACYPRLLAEADAVAETSRRGILRAASEVWDRHYPIGDASDLPFCLGTLMARLHYFPEAIQFFERSFELHGPDPRTLLQLSICQYGLHRLAIALAFVEAALTLDPHDDRARAMRGKISAELAERPHAAASLGEDSDLGNGHVRS